MIILNAGLFEEAQVNKKHIYNANNAQGPSVSVYVTYYKKDDAAKTIQAIDGSIYDGRILRASFGTTKYCTFFLRSLACPNPGCMYLHEQGDIYDSFTKEEMAMGKHHLYKSEETLQRKPIQRLGILLADQEPLPDIPLITIKAADAMKLEGYLDVIDKQIEDKPVKIFDPFSPSNNLFGNFFSAKPFIPTASERPYKPNYTESFLNDSFSFSMFPSLSMKQKSRFEFAQDSEAMQNDFRALLPNINVRFGQPKRIFDEEKTE